MCAVWCVHRHVTSCFKSHPRRLGNVLSIPYPRILQQNKRREWESNLCPSINTVSQVQLTTLWLFNSAVLNPHSTQSGTELCSAVHPPSPSGSKRLIPPVPSFTIFALQGLDYLAAHGVPFALLYSRRKLRRKLQCASGLIEGYNGLFRVWKSQFGLFFSTC